MVAPLHFYELATSRPTEASVDSKTVTRKWISTAGSNDENTIAAGFLMVAPAFHDLLPLQGYKLQPLGGGVWMCDAMYALSPYILQADTTGSLGPEFGFDITAGNVHITQSLGTRYRWLPTDVVNDGGVPGPGTNYARGKNLTVSAVDPTQVTPDGWTVSADDVGKILLVSGVQPTGLGSWILGAFYTITAQGGGKWKLGTAQPGTPGATGGMWTMVADTRTGFGDGAGAEAGNAPNYRQAIGIQIDAIQGTDIFAPKFEFTVSAQVAPLGMPYLRMIRNTCAKVNNAAWKGFDVGEVLYLGATGECSPGGVWKVQHRFAVGQNLYAVPVSVNPTTGNPDIVIPYKGAWEYLWAAYQNAADAAHGVLASIPSAAYVEQVYRGANFANLGLGV